MSVVGFRCPDVTMAAARHSDTRSARSGALECWPAMLRSILTVADAEVAPCMTSH
jgi:hypothetical protein